MQPGHGWQKPLLVLVQAFEGNKSHFYFLANHKFQIIVHLNNNHRKVPRFNFLEAWTPLHIVAKWGLVSSFQLWEFSRPNPIHVLSLHNDGTMMMVSFSIDWQLLQEVRMLGESGVSSCKLQWCDDILTKWNHLPFEAATCSISCSSEVDSYFQQYHAI